MLDRQVLCPQLGAIPNGDYSLHVPINPEDGAIRLKLPKNEGLQQGELVVSKHDCLVDMYLRDHKLQVIAQSNEGLTPVFTEPIAQMVLTSSEVSSRSGAAWQPQCEAELINYWKAFCDFIMVVSTFTSKQSTK